MNHKVMRGFVFNKNLTGLLAVGAILVCAENALLAAGDQPLMLEWDQTEFETRQAEFERKRAEMLLLEKLKAEIRGEETFESILCRNALERRYDLGSFGTIPKDVQELVMGYLNPQSQNCWSLTNAKANVLVAEQMALAKVKHEINQLISPLVHLEAGRFENMSDDLDGQRRISIESTPEIQMGAYLVTQTQYDRVMGAGSAARVLDPITYGLNCVGPNKPMGGLTYAQWEAYIERLNAEIQSPEFQRGWQIVHGPDARVPRVRIPTEAELRYAMTEKSTSILSDGSQATGVMTEHSGTNETDDLTVLQYVYYGQVWANGPSNVGTKLSNSRGIFDGNGNMWQLTSSIYPLGRTGSCRVLLGGNWISGRLGCRSANRYYLHFAVALTDVGLRVVVE